MSSLFDAYPTLALIPRQDDPFTTFFQVLENPSSNMHLITSYPGHFWSLIHRQFNTYNVDFFEFFSTYMMDQIALQRHVPWMHHLARESASGNQEQIHFLAGYLLFKENHHQESLACLERIVGVDSDVLCLISQNLHQLGDYKASIEAIRAASLLRPHDHYLHYIESKIHFSYLEFDSSYASLNKILVDQPTSIDALLLLPHILLDGNLSEAKIKESIPLFEKISDKDPFFKCHTLALLRLYCKANLFEALAHKISQFAIRVNEPLDKLSLHHLTGILKELQQKSLVHFVSKLIHPAP